MDRGEVRGIGEKEVDTERKWIWEKEVDRGEGIGKGRGTWIGEKEMDRAEGSV